MRAIQRPRARVPTLLLTARPRTASIYGRKQPELGLHCHTCLTPALADQRRRWTAHEMTVMYSDEQMSTNEIAAITGLSQSGVHAILLRRDVQMQRDPAEFP